MEDAVFMTPEEDAIWKKNAEIKRALRNWKTCSNEKVGRDRKQREWRNMTEKRKQQKKIIRLAYNASIWKREAEKPQRMTDKENKREKSLLK
jgi:hypothetical protein